MPIEYQYQGETFQLDDSNPNYSAVTYEGLTGWVGRKVPGAEGSRYVWTLSEGDVTPDGLTESSSVFDAEFDAQLDNLCAQLIEVSRSR